MNLKNYEYVGSGYYREKGIEKGKPANLLHGYGSEIIEYIDKLEIELDKLTLRF